MTAMMALVWAAGAWASDPPLANKALPTPDEAFRRMDTNRDGRVSLLEFGEHMKGNPRLKFRKEWEELFYLIDADQDGSVSREEFQTWAAKAKKRRPASF